MRLPFGLNIAPEIFQRRMETLFEGVQGVQVVMDDSLVFGSNEAEHDARVIQVLDILEKAKVTLNKDKCKFKLQEVKYLGHILTNGGLKCNPEKIRAKVKNNLSHGGCRIEQVCEDIVQNKSKLSTATSVIAHVGTNNLKDSAAELKSKFDKLSDVLKTNTNEQCEVAISSIIKRKDELAAKVDSANQIIRSICDTNNWTYIDNHAITQLKADKLHIQTIRA